MGDTKERILCEALRLFARDGYEAVSVRDIAGRLGISQSALYKHYANKRDIFESIVARMRAADYERALAYAVPEKAFGEMAAAYRSADLAGLARYTGAQFRYWTRDAFAADFRRLLTLEQYRSEEMTALYQQYLSGGVLAYLTDLFREMEGLRGQTRDAAALALAYYAPVYMLMNLYDGATDKAEIDRLADAHIEGFFTELQGGRST